MGCRQDGFMENYLSHQRESTFSNVALLIYVFDIESREVSSDFSTYTSIVHALGEFSPRAKIFCLVHKMDLISADQRAAYFARHVDLVGEHSGELWRDTVRCYQTSIWDQSLYRAWSDIVMALIPNAGELEASLRRLMSAIGATEVVLYERTTCLTVSHCFAHDRDGDRDEEDGDGVGRYEDLSSVLKTFKQSLS